MSLMNTVEINNQRIFDVGYNTGKQNEYDTFWDAFQENGNRRNYRNAFCFWKPEYYKPKYPIIGTGMAMACFWESTLEAIGVLDFSEVTSLNTAFYRNLYLKTIEKLIISEKCTNFENSFTSCNELENITIEGTISANINFRYSSKLSKASIKSIINALSTTAEGLSVTFSKTAVNKAFETSEGLADGSTSAEWIALAGDENTEGIRPNWNISLL